MTSPWAGEEPIARTRNGTGNRIMVMNRVDNRKIPDRQSEIRCFCVGRNEATRIPQFLKHHKNIGVNRFFYIDNHSDDESIDLLLRDESVHIWSTNQAYQESRFGVDWQHALLKQFGAGHWCLLLDIDEFFYFPYCDRGRTFRDFRNFLDLDNCVAVKSMMLDMYSDRSLDQTVLLPGRSLFETCPFFDRPKYLYLFFQRDYQRLQKICFQGVRQRLFSSSANIRKYILVKYYPGMQFSAGHHHFLWHGRNLAKARTFLFHFKFLNGFVEYSRESIERNCHWNASAEYKNYMGRLEMDPELIFYDRNTSIRYSNTDTLIDNKIVLPPGSGSRLSDLCDFLFKSIFKPADSPI